MSELSPELGGEKAPPSLIDLYRRHKDAENTAKQLGEQVKKQANGIFYKHAGRLRGIARGKDRLQVDRFREVQSILIDLGFPFALASTYAHRTCDSLFRIEDLEEQLERQLNLHRHIGYLHGDRNRTGESLQGTASLEHINLLRLSYSLDPLDITESYATDHALEITQESSPTMFEPSSGTFFDSIKRKLGLKGDE